MSAILLALMAKVAIASSVLLLRLRVVTRLLPLFFRTHRARFLDALFRQEEARAATAEAKTQKVTVEDLGLFAQMLRDLYPDDIRAQQRLLRSRMRQLTDATQQTRPIQRTR
jgi:hypothetical protein